MSVTLGYLTGALVTAALGGMLLWRGWQVKREASRRWSQVRKSAGIEGVKRSSGSLHSQVLEYMQRLSQTFALGTAQPLLRTGALKSLRRWYLQCRQQAGISSDITAEGFVEASLRLGIGMTCVGAVTGALFSTPLLVAGACGGFVVGVTMPTRALKALQQQRNLSLGCELPEMLEVCALGLRSGLSFDRSFALYSDHFASTLAGECARAQSLWTMGLMTREEALRDLANSYSSSTLNHCVESIIRSLRFGTSLVESLETSAAQARTDYHASIEEKVAKAPVKMMIPTGTLILPAMLLLVLGPVLLQLLGGM